MYQHTLQRLVDRPDDANKYDFGHVLVVGGGRGMIGAPLLTGLAALRMGAGVVTIASISPVIEKIEAHTLDLLTFHVPDDKREALHMLRMFISERKVSAIVWGSGADATLAALAVHVLPDITMPIVLDAAAITAFRGNLDALAQSAQTNPGIILTPHDGEYQRLTGRTLSREHAERSHQAKEFAVEHHLTLVCKGHHSIVAHRDGTLYQEQRGNPSLAKAGTGDVLAGIIGALLAQRVEASEAADIGVHVHAVAGDRAAADKTEAGVLASELVEYLPEALRLVAGP